MSSDKKMIVPEDIEGDKVSTLIPRIERRRFWVVLECGLTPTEIFGVYVDYNDARQVIEHKARDRGKNVHFEDRQEGECDGTPKSRLVASFYKDDRYEVMVQMICVDMDCIFLNSEMTSWCQEMRIGKFVKLIK